MPNFDDGKDRGALRTIGEVSEALGIKPHILRYWEDQFPTLKPLKRAGGRRLYRPEDIAAIERIDSLVNREGYTLKGAKAALKAVHNARAEADGGADSANVEAVPQDLLPRLRAMRAELAALLAA